jgi:hypothetical protein
MDSKGVDTMRMIHDVEAPMTVCGSGHPYRNVRSWCGQQDMQVSVEAFTDCASNHPEIPSSMFGDDEAIRIEGNSKYILQMLKSMVSCLEGLIEVSEKVNGPKRKTDCPNCKRHEDYPNGTHTEDCFLNKTLDNPPDSVQS